MGKYIHTYLFFKKNNVNRYLIETGFLKSQEISIHQPRNFSTLHVSLISCCVIDSSTFNSNFIKYLYSVVDT